MAHCDPTNLQATVHLLYWQWMGYDNDNGDYEEVPHADIYSYPAQVLELNSQRVVVETCEEEPTQYTFHIYEAPNGAKEWEVDPECLTYADDIQLTLCQK